MTNSVNASFLGFGVQSRRCQLPRILVRNYEHYVNLGRLDCIDGLDRGRQYVLKRFNILANIDGVWHREFAAHCNFILNPCTITNQAGICTQTYHNKCTLCKFYVLKLFELFETFLVACQSLSMFLFGQTTPSTCKNIRNGFPGQFLAFRQWFEMTNLKKRPFIKATSLFSFPSVLTNILK